MANNFWEQLGPKLPQLAMAVLAAKQGGMPALGAFQGGAQQAQQRSQELARQAQMDEERRAQQAAVEARAARDDDRLEEQQRFQRLTSALGAMDSYAASQGETAMDPVAAENAILSRGAGLESAYGLPQGQLSSFVPNMAPAISTRKKKVAQELYAQAEKLYGPEAMAGDSITLQSEAFGAVKPSELRALFAPQAFMNPSPDAVRPDGSMKGQGFLGPQRRPDGSVSSEISIGVEIDGREVDIPTLVPTLSERERQWLITNDISDPRSIPDAIVDKAIEHARTRIAAGQSPFADSGGRVPAPLAVGKQTPPTPGSFEEFTTATPERQAQIAADRKAYLQADDRPQAATSPRDERLVQIMGPQGTPIWVRESDAVGKPAAQAARAVTGQERQALAYYNRAKKATEDIETPDQSGASLEDRVAKAGIVRQGRLQYAPNWAQSPENQAYRQAQRAFTEARLRKESGAAIPPAEYENDARTYFAQPGDATKTIDQKRAARRVVLDGLKFGAGKAYAEYYGDEAQGATETWIRDSRGKLVRQGQ